MNRWIEKQRHLIDFTASSLARRKGKSLGLLVVYTLLVFVLASVSLYTHALRNEATRVLGATLLAGMLFAATFVDAAWQRSAHEPALQRTAELVTRLRLSDVVLFTEARYTRHLTQADLHSAFQDHPVALEHFPSGALLPPPRILLDRHEALDRKATSPD